MARKYEPNWVNIRFLVLTQAGPSVVTFMLFTYAMKFSLVAEINQGCIVSLFGMTSLISAIVFYFVYGETISATKWFGMVLMSCCVIALLIESKQEVDVSGDGEEVNRFLYGSLAILLALSCPFFWVMKVYYLRQGKTRYNIQLSSLAIDTGIAYNGINCLFLIPLLTSEVKLTSSLLL